MTKMLKKPGFYDGIQLIQSHLYATTGSASGKPYILTARQKSLSPRLVKNAQMQGSSFDKLRINSPEE
jgi:hypothetical protein